MPPSRWPWPQAAIYHLGRLLAIYGRYPLLLLALSLLFFSAQHLTRAHTYITPQILLNAIDADIRTLAQAQGPSQALHAEIDAQLRPLVHPSQNWPAAYWAWLSQWDGPRLAIYARVGWTVLLALVCLALTVLLAQSWSLVRTQGWFQQASAGLLGVLPAYVLVFALADGLKHLHLGNLPLEVLALAAVAIGDGVLINTMANLREAHHRLAQRDFVHTVRARRTSAGLTAYLNKVVLIDLIPHGLGRLSVLVGTIVVLGIVPGLYPGTLGPYLNLHDPTIWLAYSLDALWGLGAALVLLSLIADRASARWQRDKKGLDHPAQLLGHAPPRPPTASWTLAALVVVATSVAAIGAVHWSAPWPEVLDRFGHSLGSVLVGGLTGLALTVAIGLLLPLYSHNASNLILQFFEAIPRVIGIAFLMTAYNLATPGNDPLIRWLVWSFLLGLFSFAEIGRGLYSQVLLLEQVDFVNGLKALGLTPWQIFRLHLWPQLKYRVYAGIYPLIGAIAFCEAAIAILRFAMPGIVIRLFPLGSLLAESTERFTYGQWQGLTIGLATVGLIAACIELGSYTLRQGWYQLFLRHERKILPPRADKSAYAGNN